jgi:hypothetical protein
MSSLLPLAPVLTLSISLLAQQLPQGITGADWDGIRAAHLAAWHTAAAVDGGYEARNVAQQWRTRFDGRGFLVEPDAGAWTWGLELVSFGSASDQRAVDRPRRIAAEGPRVTYAWDRGLDEWYVNGTDGLEHGYTVHGRPDGTGPLVLALRVRGPLVPQVTSNGRDVRFVQAGDLALTYAGLVVFDADGRRLPAVFDRVADGLRLSIDADGARYPLTVDPVAQQAYLKASNTDAADRFGWVVAAAGDTVAVGAYGEDSAATGVNGNQADNSATNPGAVYVFVRTGTTWTQQAYLKASNPGDSDWFGSSLALSRDTLVVGAYQEGSAASGVNGNQADNSAANSGAAYVFVRNGTAWSQQAYLKASNTSADDYFGFSVAIDDDTIVVGAYGEDSSATGVNGNQADNGAINSGAAYVFERTGTTWSQQAYLKASNTGVADYFGYCVAVDGHTVVVGAMAEDSGATGVNGNQADDSSSASGAVYVFTSGGGWSQQAYLKASNTGAGDFFGRSLALDDETLVVGAQGEDSGAPGINGNQGDNSASNAGAAYVFVRSLGYVWSQQAYLKASNPEATDAFGVDVAIDCGTIVVGAAGEDSGAVGVNGNQADNSVAQSGAAYVFVRNVTSWSQLAYLKASNPAADDWFGLRVAVAGDTVVVGAYGEDSSAVGVNGNQTDNGAPDAGAAYTFDLGLQTISSLAARAYLKASNTDAGDGFGRAVAAAGDTVVVSAWAEASNAGGINGNQTNNGLSQAGAVYVFVRSGTTWTQQAYLKPSNPDALDKFGTSVAISGDTIVVGAPDERSGATGVNGNQGDNSLAYAGAAYVFVRTGTTWTQQAYLKASNTGGYDRFGYSVGISGDTIVVGAFWERSSATGVNGNQADDSAPDAGAAYVFVRNGTIWSQQAYLKASNTEAGDGFGWAVAVHGDTIAVGAYQEDSNAGGVNGNGADNSAPQSGAAYVFVRNGAAWSQQAYLKASNTNADDAFGAAVALHADTVVVGAWGEDSAATGVNGNQSDNSMTHSGAGYVFVRTGATWTQQAYLKASNTGFSDWFGTAVAISGDSILVGAYTERSGADGIGGCQEDDSVGTAGACYLFAHNGTSWSQQAYVKATNSDANDAFGLSVALAGDVLVAGAYRETSAATGVDGDQADNSAYDAGAAYVFDRGTFGSGCAGTNGVPALSAATAARLHRPYTVGITNLNPTYNLAVLVFGFTQLPGIDLGPLLGMAGCKGYQTPDALISVAPGAAGAAAWSWLPVAGMLGDTLYVQALCFDPPANTFGFTISNALAVTIVN